MLNHNGLKVHKALCHTKGTVLCISLSNLLLLFLFSNQEMRIYRPRVVSWYIWYHFFTLFPFLQWKLHTIPPNMWSQGPCTLHTRNIYNYTTVLRYQYSYFVRHQTGLDLQVHYIQHPIQWDMRQQIHVHAIFQVVCCWIQTKTCKKQNTHNFNNNK